MLWGQPMRDILRAARAPLLSVLGALAIGGFLMILTGHNPLEAYAAMAGGALSGRNFANLAATLVRATPIVGMGLAAAIAFRAGFFNLGGEGQLVLGGLTAAVVALMSPLPAPLTLVVALVAASAVGGAYAWVAAFGQIRFEVPLLISTLLLNYPAMSLASYLTNHRMRDVASGMAQTQTLPAGVHLPTFVSGGRLHWGVVIVLVLTLVVAFLARRSVGGYHARLSGLNVRFLKYGGINTDRLGYRVMFLSGAVAGLVGAVQVFAVHHRFIDGSLTQPLYAWTGLMVALLARSRPLGVLVGGIFFAAVQTGGFGMERATDVPREISIVIQALIILLVAARTRFEFGKTTGAGTVA
jgi:ABC-type uncharacterized transport system permease subunit